MTENCDPQELAKFASLSAQWWDPVGPLKTLHQINPLRLEYIKKKTLLENQIVIDIGCGGGILAESMAQQGAWVTGIDLSQAAIDVANLHQHDAQVAVEYLHISAETLATQRPRHYDIVTCLEMLEHVPDPGSVIQACATLVKPGGHVFFSTLNRHPKSYLFAILAAEYLLKLLPKNTHDYAKFIRPSELSRWACQAQLIPQDVQGIAYSPVSQQFTFSQDPSVNYLFYARRPI